MRRITVMSLAAVLVTLGGAPATHADTPGCVSRHEYNRIAKGMTMTKVHKIFDTTGTSTGLGGKDDLRYYRACSRLSQVQVTFNGRDRVISKGANWY